MFRKILLRKRINISENLGELSSKNQDILPTLQNRFEFLAFLT